MSAENHTVVQIVFEEYGELKAEQRQRIATRDNLIYVTLVSLAAVIAAATGSSLGLSALLLVAPITTALGWTFLSNDRKITQIGVYIRGGLTAMLRSGAGTVVEPFGWEAAHLAVRSRRRSKIYQMLIDLIVFCLPSLVAAGVFMRHADPGPLSALTAAAGVVMASVLGWEIWRAGRAGE